MNSLISLSGGLDSCVLLSLLIEQKAKIKCITFKYGSKHEAYEINAAKKIAYYYGLAITIVDLTSIIADHFRSNLLIGQGQIPEGHYQQKDMALTIVPARNILFLATLTGIAQTEGHDTLAIGVHQGDHYIYPDCRPDFIHAMEQACCLGSGNVIKTIYTPLLHLSKAEIVKHGVRLRSPFHLTRTCYKEQEFACGKCGSCNERLEAFRLNNIEDPIQYEVDNDK